MDRILDRLYCGSFNDVPTCHRQGVTCVISLCEAAPEPVPGVLMIHLPIPDEVFLSSSVWVVLTEALSTCLRENYVVLVHCRLGVSRAPSLCALHVAQSAPMSIGQAFDYVQSLRFVANPHQATRSSALDYYLSQARNTQDE